MALQCGIVGLPNVGKSTLFSALSNAKAEVANYPFCTIEPNVGIITVPDSRLKVLEELVNPEKVLPTVIEFVDIAGLVKGASKGEGLGNQFLATIREVDTIVHVVRCFEDDNIIHVDGRVNPVEDKDVIDTELQIKDLENVEKRMVKIAKKAKSGDKDAKKEFDVLDKLKNHLEKGENARSCELSENEAEIAKEYQLLTIKPVIYVANVDEDSLKADNAHVTALKAKVAPENALVITVCASLEAQIAEFEEEEEKQMLLDEYGMAESGLAQLIRAGYDTLDLITYFTAGEKEVRAWTIKKGWTAPQAAGVIHTDFEHGFIKAEVIKYDDYAELGSEQACKEAGKLGIEGKAYVVGDGDVMHFRFNV